MDNKVYLIIFLIAICYIVISSYLEYTSINRLYQRFYDSTDYSGYIENHNLIVSTPENIQQDNTDKEVKIANLDFISDNLYNNDLYDLQISIPEGYRYTLNSDDSIFIGNEDGDNLMIKVLSNPLEQFKGSEVERYCNIFNEVEEITASIGNREYQGVAGYQLFKGLDVIEHKEFIREVPEKNEIISIEAHFRAVNYPVLGTIFAHDGIDNYEILTENSVKTLDISNDDKEEIIDESSARYKELQRERTEPGLFDKGTWERNVYTNDLLDIKITMPPYWGFSTSIDNYFEISSSDHTEFITLRVLNNNSKDEMEREINNYKEDNNISHSFKKFTCKIGKDEYIGFTHINKDSDFQDSYFYREVNEGKYLLSIHTYMKDESLDILGEIFAKNDDNTFKLKYTDSINTERKIWPSEAFGYGVADDDSYINDYLGIKIYRPKDWAYFDVYTNSLSMKKTTVSGTVHDMIDFDLHDEYLTYGTIKNEVDHVMGYMTQFGYITIEKREKIQGLEVSTVTCLTTETDPEFCYVKKYYYIPLLDGKYILEIRLDCDQSIYDEIDINDIIKINNRK